MFDTLKEINQRPKPFEFYTASELWTNEHTAQQMLQYHLNDDIEASSRKSTFIEKSCNWIAEYFNIGGKKVIDFGCGPGLYAQRLAQKGAFVTGIDFSVNSINHARTVAHESGLSIHYLVSDYLELETDEKFDLITMIMCDFCALSPAQRKTLLGKFNAMLKPKGSILMDVYSLKAFEKKVESATYEKNQLFGFWSPNDYYAFVNTFKYEDEKVLLDKYTIIEANQPRRIVYNWLQHYSFDALQREFNQNNLTIRGKFANVAGEDFSPKLDEFAIIAVQ
ncbi:MAG: class I SAM-dependent methyltransferase [Desulfobacterales bacterium]|nr:class I SAM-dependent methyltransferase [Desulfobacterales bacterium]